MEIPHEVEELILAFVGLKRKKGKTYHPSLDHYNYWSAPAGLSAPFNYVVSSHS